MTEDQNPPIRRATTFVIPPRLQLWKQTVCKNCHAEFEQLLRGKKRTCPDCRKGRR